MQEVINTTPVIPSPGGQVLSPEAVIGVSQKASAIINAITEKLKKAQVDPLLAPDNQVTVGLSAMEYSDSEIQEAIRAFSTAGYYHMLIEDPAEYKLSITW